MYLSSTIVLTKLNRLEDKKSAILYNLECIRIKAIYIFVDIMLFFFFFFSIENENLTL
jgi:hypothetical protein